MNFTHGQSTPPASAQGTLSSASSKRTSRRAREHREHDERFRALALATGQLVWTAGPAGDVRGENAAWRAYTGQQSGKVSGWGWENVVHPDDQERLARILQHALASSTSYEAECRLRRHDGEYRVFLVRGVPVREPDGVVREWVGCGTDITERKRAEAEATTRARDLEAILDSIAEPIAIFNAEGRIVRMNAAMRASLPADEDPTHGHENPIERARFFAMRDEHGRPFSEDEIPVRRVLRGEALTGSHAVEIVLRRSDCVEHRVIFSGMPLRDESGHITGAVCMYRDVTTRRAEEHRTTATLNALIQMAQALVQPPMPEASETETDPKKLIAQRLLDLMVEVIGCKRAGISEFDRVTELSTPLAVAGLSPEQEAKWWEEQAQQPQVPLSESPEQEMVARLRAGEPVLFDMRQPPYNEQPNPYNIKVVVIAPMVAGQQLIGFLTLDYGGEEHEYTPDDLTLITAVTQLAAFVLERARLLEEREEARANELAIRRAKERVDDFVSMANHELKSPLTSVRLNLQRLLRQQRTLTDAERTPQDTQRADILNRSLHQIDRLLRLVEDMLDAARAQSGRLEVRPEPVDLGEIVREMVREQREAWPSRAITLALPDGEQAPVEADPDRIGQVLTNFLSNALKYTPQETPIAVELGLANGMARVAVRDQGPGLTPEQQQHVWDLYYQAVGIENQAGTGKGLGLGLFITRDILTRHGGTFGVESTPGAGAIFWFALPLRESA